MESFLDSIPMFINIASLVISLAAAIAAATKTPKDDGVVKTLRKVIDFLALNFGNARNK